MFDKKRFGVSTHIVKDIDPEKHFRLFVRCGFSLVELNLGYFTFLENSDKFRELQGILAHNGIRAWSFHLPYGGTIPSLGFMDISHPDIAVRRNTIEAIRLCFDRLIALNARCLVIHPGVGFIEEDTRKERSALCVESLKECVDMLREVLSKKMNPVRLKIAVETLPPGSLGETGAEMLSILGQVDSNYVGICLDVNHCNLKQDLIESTQKIGGRIITTHLSDNDGERERHWMPGKGVIPWKQWLSTLLSSGYSGPLIYETSQEEGVSAEETVAHVSRNAKELFLMI
jgi:sugar phosphate isomerase/epimerase